MGYSIDGDELGIGLSRLIYIWWDYIDILKIKIKNIENLKPKDPYIDGKTSYLST